MMTKTGILFVTNPNKFLKYIPNIEQEVKNTLYVQFLSKWHHSYLNNASIKNTNLNGPMFSTTVINFYRNSLIFNNIDVRVLLNSVRQSNIPVISTKKQIEIVYFDETLNLKETQSVLMKCICNLASDCKRVCFKGDAHGIEENHGADNLLNNTEITTYDNVVLGGTFDRLHAGHKILLSEAVLRCNKKLTVGVTNTEMLKSKKLWELIEPCDVRMNKVKEFLEDVEPCLDYNVVPIGDMYGPTKDDPTFQMLVVSSETIRGGVKVNDVRTEKGLNPLVVHSVDLLSNPHQEDEEEDKISSSNDRLRLLGRIIRPVQPRTNLPALPYTIGMIGGIASGKSSVCKRLANLGAEHINCDEIGHNIYKKGTLTYDTILKTFTDTNLLDESGEICRKTLGKIVFNDKEARNMLNNIMWPAILNKSKEMAMDSLKLGKQVVILEAALLLDAGWSAHCNEIWACIIPPEEAIERLKNRNQLTTEEAKLRLSSLPTNTKLVENANIVFCTLWKPEFTQKQVERAWNDLNKRLGFVGIGKKSVKS